MNEDHSRSPEVPEDGRKLPPVRRTRRLEGTPPLPVLVTAVLLILAAVIAGALILLHPSEVSASVMTISSSAEVLSSTVSVPAGICSFFI